MSARAPAPARAIGALVVVAAILGCGDGRVDQAASGWWADSIPVVDIAGSAPEGDLVLVDPVGATVLSDGAIVVADRWGFAVRFFDASGRPIRTVGRRGEGPGEFAALTWLGHCGRDTVVVWDTQNRASVIGADGRLVRQFPIPADPAMGSSPTFLACSSTGTFAYLGAPRNFPAHVGDLIDMVVPLALADAQGRVTHALGDVPAWDGRTQGRLTQIALSNESLYVGTAEVLRGRRLRTGREPAGRGAVVRGSASRHRGPL